MSEDASVPPRVTRMISLLRRTLGGLVSSKRTRKRTLGKEVKCYNSKKEKCKATAGPLLKQASLPRRPHSCVQNDRGLIGNIIPLVWPGFRGYQFLVIAFAER